MSPPIKRVVGGPMASVDNDPEAPPTALWLALTQLPRPHRAVPFPRALPGSEEPVGDVTMWPLTQQEQMDANAAADRYTKALLINPQKAEEANLGYHHTYSNETAVQILWRACRDPLNLGNPAFPSPKLIRHQFTTDEIGVLFEKYVTVQTELGPIIAFMAPEQMEAMILRIQESGSYDPFDSLSSEAKRSLVCFMAAQIVSCWTVMSSAGLPLDVTTFAREAVARIVDDIPAQPTEESTTSDDPAQPAQGDNDTT